MVDWCGSLYRVDEPDGATENPKWKYIYKKKKKKHMTPND